METKRSPIRWQLILFFCLVGLGALAFRLVDYEHRTFWNVDQSLLLWQIKSLVADRKISLIGLHFFSLLNGPVYRTPFANWILSIPIALFGLKVSVLVVTFTAISLASMILISKVAQRLGGTLAWQFALILYAFSWFIRQEEMRLWYAALMIPLSSLSIWWLFGRKTKPSLTENVVLGLILGLGFSLHFVILWLIAGVLIYWFLVDRRGFVAKSLGLLLGLVVMVSPLIMFNIRHNFIMKQGIINMLTGKAVEDRATFVQRLGIVTAEVPCVISTVAGGACRPFWQAAFVVASLLTLLFSKNPAAKRFLLYTWVNITIAALGLFYAGRLSYSSRHYLLYLAPLVVVTMALAFAEISHSRIRIVGLTLIVIVVYGNLAGYRNYQDDSSYFFKRELAQYVYALPTRERIGLMFYDQHTLAYDFLFYEAAKELGVPYEKINLIERWGSDKPDGYVFLNEEPGASGKLFKFGESKLLLTREFINKNSL